MNGSRVTDTPANVLTRALHAVLLTILLTRSSLDPVLTLTQSGSTQAGYNAGSAGLGAGINAMVLICGVLCWIGSRNRKERLEMLWLPIMIVMFIGIVRSPFVVGAERTAAGLLTYAAMFTLGLVFTRDEASLETHLRFVILSSAVPLLYGVADYALGQTILEGQHRVQSTFAHPNIFGFYLNTIVAALAAYRFCVPKPRLSNTFCYVIFAAALAELMLSQSRSAWIATAIQIGMLTLFISRPMFVVVAALASLSSFVPAVQNRLSSLQDGNSYRGGWQTRLNSYAWRKLLWERGLQDLGDDWPWGRGLDAFRTSSPVFFPLERIPVYPHNVYVQLLYDVGAVGLTLYLFIFAALIWAAVRVGRPQRIAVVIFIGLLSSHLIVSYSDNVLDYLSYDWYFWFVVGAMLAALRRRLLTRGAIPHSVQAGVRATHAEEEAVANMPSR